MRPLYLGSAELTRWLTSPLDPVMSRAKTSPTTSPPTLIVSLPRPPMTRVSIPGGDDDVVGVLGAQDDQLVEPGAAVDRDGRVHVVHDLVLPGPGADVGLRGGREAARQLRHGDHRLGVEPDDLACRSVLVGIARRAARGSAKRRLGEREAADDEQVVARDALEPERRLVRVDDERVVAGPALGEDRLAVAAAEPSARRRDSR